MQAYFGLKLPLAFILVLVLLLLISSRVWSVIDTFQTSKHTHNTTHSRTSFPSSLLSQCLPIYLPRSRFLIKHPLSYSFSALSKGVVILLGVLAPGLRRNMPRWCDWSPLCLCVYVVDG